MNKRATFIGTLCAVLAFTAGCDVRGTIQRATPPAADRLARVAIAHAASGTLASLDSAFTSVMRTPASLEALKAIETAFRRYSVGEPDLIGYEWHRTNGKSYRTLTYQAHLTPSVDALSPDDDRGIRWMTARVLLSGGAGAFRIAGFHVNFSVLSLAEANGFLRNIGLPQLLWLLLAASAATAAVCAVVQVIRAPLRRRWPWVIVSLLGAASATMNWTTGAFAIRPISLLLFPVAFIRQGLYGPIMFTWAFPAGAFWALEVARRARRRAAFIAMLERGRGDVGPPASPDDPPTC